MDVCAMESGYSPGSAKPVTTESPVGSSSVSRGMSPQIVPVFRFYHKWGVIVIALEQIHISQSRGFTSTMTSQLNCLAVPSCWNPVVCRIDSCVLDRRSEYGYCKCF
ncbi:hypothetical protein CDAR_179791 [Caerostris darwini]|uniref:Uncharacterized protein n=1 Tax=Caerostris darwini TaxID=1538125 RepID=A0AAV4RNH1_9ARAC|nr:hypothetical protein CDAR_179791 [Caerostris darwini]